MSGKRAHLFFRAWLALGLRLFYRKITIEGKENIPTGGGHIFVSNHNNAAIDAFLMTAWINPIPYYIARADIFKKPWLGKLLRWFNLIPIYRLRDGVEISSANVSSFSRTVEVLSDEGNLLIFPEGNNSRDFHLLRLKKGLARICWQTLEVHPDLDLKLVPVGITYERLHTVGSDVLQRIDQPIPVQPLKAKHDNPQSFNRELTELVSQRIKELMFHQELDSGERLKEIVKVAPRHLSLREKLEWGLKRLSESQVDPEIAESRKTLGWQMLLRVLLAPIALIGWILHLLPYQLPVWLSYRISTAPPFHTSILFGLLWVLLPMLYIVQSLLITVIFGWQWGLMALLVHPLLSIFTWWWGIPFRQNK